MGEADPDGGAVVVAGQVHEPAQSHADNVRGLIVGVGAILPKRCDRNHNQLGVDLGQHVIAEPKSV